MNRTLSKCHLLVIEFIITPAFFFLLITNLIGDKFGFIINLIVLISFVSLFGIFQVLFLTTLKKSPVLPDGKGTKLTTNTGIGTSIIFPLLLILTYKIYFERGILTLSLSRYYFLGGCLIWGLSLLLISYLVFRTPTKRANVFAIGGAFHALVIPLVSIIYYDLIFWGVLCYTIPLLSISSVLMAVVSGAWINENIDRIT